MHPSAKSGEGRIAQRIDDSKYQIIHLLPHAIRKSGSVGFENPYSMEAAGMIPVYWRSLIISGTLYTAPFTMSVII